MNAEQLLRELVKCESGLKSLTAKVESILADVERLAKAETAVSNAEPEDPFAIVFAKLAKAEAAVADLEDMAAKRWGRAR
jgi:hypothetical protein